jgi:DNA repair exonuclease SbcCD ATPase subunit
MILLYIAISDLFGEIMLEPSSPEETKQDLYEDINAAILMLKNLDNEMKSLQEEKRSLQEIEENLRLRLEEEIETKRRQVSQLKAEVEQIRERCEELTNFVNSQFVSKH